MLAIIEFPIPGQDAAFGLKPFVKSGVRKRRDDGEAGQVDASLDREFCRFQKHIRPIVVEAEYKTSLKRNSVFVKPLDNANKLLWRIKCLVALSEILRRDGFQSHQQALAAASRSRFEQFQIFG